nr:reverse transcriptase domain-containing protein [Tanacetum cinerariifolium]
MTPFTKNEITQGEKDKKKDEPPGVTNERKPPEKKIESLMGFKYMCFLDAYKGYHQIQMAKKEEEKTVFYADEGVFCYTKMPFGLKNVGSTYQRLVDTMFEGQMGRNLEAYVDDMVIKSKTEPDMIKDIKETLLTLKKRQVLADFLADPMAEDGPADSRAAEMDKTLVEGEVPEVRRAAVDKAPTFPLDEADTWKIYTDGASNPDRARGETIQLCHLIELHQFTQRCKI